MKMQHIAVLTLLLGLTACKNPQQATIPQSKTPNYTNPLPAGQQALQKVATTDWPDVGKAWETRDLFLQDSMDNSVGWFDAPSSHQWFPIEGVSHAQAKNSVIVLRTILK